jgi:predicted transcriptional regulator
MAKKKSQSLTKRIAALINRVGEKPEPTFGDIKSELVECLGLAETLENGAAVREAEAKIAALETALEESNLENVNLKAELSAANAEIETFRVEQKKREEKETEIDPTQFQILQRLPSQSSGDWLRIDEIATAVKIPVDEAEVYINGLEELDLVFFQPHEPRGGGWRRTAEGNKLIVAKRWAGEEEPKGKKRKHADLSKPEEIALLMMTRNDGEGATEAEIAKELGISVLAATLVLSALREKEMATDGDEPQQTYGTSPEWWLLKNGKEYLAERGLL